MALSPRIELRQSQSLVMTPQLQQAIKLLQMSNLQLAEYLTAEVEKNAAKPSDSDRAKVEKPLSSAVTV